MTKETKDTAVTDVAVIDSAGRNVPSFLQNAPKSGGLQGLDAKDFIVPRIKLLQGVSQEVKDGLPGAEAGVFWLTVSEQPLGQELRFTVVNNRVRVLLLAPRDDGQGILARADDGRTWDKTGSWDVKIKNIRQAQKWAILDKDVEKSGLLNFGTSVPEDPQSNPAATKFYDFLTYLPDFNTLAVLSLARSQSKKAKDLISKIGMATANGDVGMHALSMVAGIVTDTNGSDTYSNYKFRMDGYVDEATYKRVVALDAQFQSFRMDERDLEEASGVERGAAKKDSAEY